jgi:hypothetical protein
LLTAILPVGIRKMERRVATHNPKKKYCQPGQDQNFGCDQNLIRLDFGHQQYPKIRSRIEQYPKIQIARMA